MEIKELLKKGNEILKENNIDEYMLKCKLLLSSVLKKEKEYLVIHDDEIIDDEKQNLFFDGVDKLIKGIPIQYIINKQEFMGLDFYVDENVLIPQPDTEVLVQEISNYIKQNNKILDLCTGSGAVGIAIAKLYVDKNIEVTLSDISENALVVASKNCNKNDICLKIIQSDMFENIDQKFDIIVSNPPYIESEVINNLDFEVKNEPHIALDGGIDGLKFYRIISKQAKNYLNENGFLGLEIGYNQKNSVINILKNDGYCDIKCIKDYSNNDRVIICRKGE